MRSLVSGPLDVWPVGEALVVSWLKLNLPGVNVRTETDASFGTSSPAASMTVPLVLVASAPGGRTDPNLVTRSSLVDLQCFSDSRAGAWDLHQRCHAWMLRAIGRATPVGAVDDVWISNEAAIVNYSNPSLRRVITTYGIATRAQATA